MEEVHKAPSWEANSVVPCEFTVTNFTYHRERSLSWYSSPFYSHFAGYKLCLRLDANGDGRGKGSHISLYVSLMKGEHDDWLTWPFHGEVTVLMLNWCEDKNHIEEKIRFNELAGGQVCDRVIHGARAKVGRGRNQFIAHSNLGKDKIKNVEFCQEDCLRLRVKKVTLIP